VKWRPGQGGGQVEDRRASGGGGMGGRGVLPVGGGLGGIIAVVLVLLLGGGGGGGFGVDNPFDQFPAQAQPGGSGRAVPGAPDPESELVDFVSFVMGDLQKFWAEDFQRAGKTYERTQLVLFRQATQTGCGTGSAQTGPFYCPVDHQVYLDLGFFRELATRFEAGGDFAQAYVIAHEVGHHVQTLTGIEGKVGEARRDDPSQANALSVRLELQADCLAGVWAHSTYERGLLEQGDLEEGLTAAASVGDDRIQKQTTGRISPESFTHGTAEQRAGWFKRGFDSGVANDCDTFSGDI
jgi:predicted metalloprotease